MRFRKDIISKIDFNKLKNILIVSFCIFSAVMNIITICGSKKDSVICFSEQPVIESESFAEPESVSDAAVKPVKQNIDQTAMLEYKININTASKSELMKLKGIGESKASAIIEYRDEYGGFVSIEEIKLVKGIGDKIFSNIKDEICIE